MNTKSKITQRQNEILIQLYKFRFLNRKHIQSLLNHKDHRRIQSWLNKLTEKKYITQYYNNKLAPLPAVYSLDRYGRKHLKSLSEVKIKPLNRVWRESKYSNQFREHCLFLADIYLSLLALVSKNKATLDFKTKSELHGIGHLISPYPDAYIAIIDKADNAKRYFLDIFDDIPPVFMRKRVKQYLEYYNSDEWQDNTNKPFPEIILICPNSRLKSHLYHFIKKKLSDEEPSFYLAIKDMVITEGLNKNALTKVIIET